MAQCKPARLYKTEVRKAGQEVFWKPTWSSAIPYWGELENNSWTYCTSLALITYIHSQKNYKKEFHLLLINWESCHSLQILLFIWSLNEISVTRQKNTYTTSKGLWPEWIKSGKQPFLELSNLYFHLSILHIKQITTSKSETRNQRKGIPVLLMYAPSRSTSLWKALHFILLFPA